MKVGILGSSGFIGKHLTRKIISEGIQCVGIDRNPSDISSDLFESVLADFSEIDTIVDAVVQCDVLIHAISSTVPGSSIKNRIFDIESNLVNTVKLLEKLSRIKRLRIVFLSSGGTVYGEQRSLAINESMATNPICSYGIVKLAIEKYLLEFDRLGLIDAQILRVSNPYGTGVDISKGQGVIPVFSAAMIQGRKISIAGDGNVLKDYIYIDDVIEAIYLGITYTGIYKIFNISTFSGTSLNNILDIIRGLLKLDCSVEYVDKLKYDCGNNILDNSLARKHLNWVPKFDIKTGIQQYLICTK